MNASRGFTMIEALLAMATLCLLAAATAVVYSSGRESVDAHGDETLLISALRSGMESAAAVPFDQLSSGTTNVTVGSRTVVRTTTVSTVDLNGDGTDEPDARSVTVTMDGRTLSLLRVSHGGWLMRH
jgi:type II secretory pathway pseudopilin PulG